MTSESAPQVVRPFHIMAKPVCGVCNLDCQYCYYTSKPAELYPGVDRFMMTDEVLESYTRQYLQAMPQRCEFGWQGGEPLLAGKEFFQKAVDLQASLAAEGQTVSNALQTNGTLLDEQWCAFFAEHNFLIGISLDGPPEWHDRFRRDHAGGKTFHKAWAGLEMLKRHGAEFNVLVTLNSANAPHAGDIYRYFTNRGIHYVQFIPILERTPDGRPTDFSCTAEQFGQFMMEVFDLWARRDVGQISERLIDSVLHQLIFGQPAACCYAERCANAHVLEFNGDLYACDHFVYPQWKIGNILERPLSELVRDERLEEFACLKTDLPRVCRECEFVAFCRGGCPKHHMPLGNDPERVNHFCEGYKRFFREALPELRRMAEYFKRNQVPPKRGEQAESPDAATHGSAPAHPPAAATAPAPAAAPGRVPGRNDPCPCGSGRKFKVCCGRK